MTIHLQTVRVQTFAAYVQHLVSKQFFRQSSL